MSSTAAVPDSAAGAPHPKRWIGLAVLLIANFMNLIDVTIVNVALPSMRENLGATDSQIEWVVAAYVLAFALGLLPFGRLGDILGRKLVFLWGVSAFTAASALCGMAGSVEMLIAARVLQGLAGAMMTPQVLAIATVTFPPNERGQAFSLFGLTAGLASVSGPILGGVLIEAQLFGLDWEPIFLVNIPIGIAAVIAGYILIPRLPGHRELRNDLVGIVLFGLGIVAVVFPIIEGRAYGWPAWAFGLMLAGFVVLALFFLWTKRRAEAGEPQLLNYGLLANRDFMFGAMVVTIYASGIPGLFLVISLMLQSGFGMTALESGLTNTPFSIGVLIASFIANRFGAHYLRSRLAAAGLMLSVGIGAMHFIIGAAGGETFNGWSLLVPLLVAGVGLGTGFSSMFQLVLRNVPPRDAGAGSGALQAFQQVGGALGVAIVGELFFTQLAQGLGSGMPRGDAFAHAASFALWFQVISFVLVTVLAFRFRKSAPSETGAVPRAAPVEG